MNVFTFPERGPNKYLTRLAEILAELDSEVVDGGEPGSPRNEVRDLEYARMQKMWEIVEYVAAHKFGLTDDVANLDDGIFRRVARYAYDATELWESAEMESVDGSFVAEKDEFMTLLSEHYELGQQLLDALEDATDSVKHAVAV